MKAATAVVPHWAKEDQNIPFSGHAFHDSDFYRQIFRGIDFGIHSQQKDLCI
jgi:hypothetical protein